jgi:hypothetical protein
MVGFMVGVLPAMGCEVKGARADGFSVGNAVGPLVGSGLRTAPVGATKGARADGFSVGDMDSDGVALAGEAKGTSVGMFVGPAVLVGVDGVRTTTSVDNTVGLVVVVGVAPTGGAEGTSVVEIVGPVVSGADWVGTNASAGNAVGPTVAPATGEAEGTLVGKMVSPALVGTGVVGW